MQDRIQFKYLIWALRGQGPFKRFIKNFFITGNAWGMFSVNSHRRADNSALKASFSTVESVQKTANAMTVEYGKHFSFYRCVFCGKYHIGKNRDNK